MKNIEKQKKENEAKAALIKSQVSDIIDLLPVYAKKVKKSKRFGFDLGFVNSGKQVANSSIVLWFKDEKDFFFEESFINLESCLKTIADI